MRIISSLLNPSDCCSPIPVLLHFECPCPHIPSSSLHINHILPLHTSRLVLLTPCGVLFASTGVEAASSLCSVTKTAARCRCPRGLKGSRMDGVLLMLSTPPTPMQLGAVSCLYQVLGVQGQSGRGM